MKFVNRYLFIFILLIISNSTTHAQDEYVIFDKIQGYWQVSEHTRHLGTLVIRDSSYTFLPKYGVKASASMKKRFTFIDQLKGAFVIESYSVNPEDRIEDLEGRSSNVIMTCRFNDEAKNYLIRFDQENNELYFHATIAEVQVYHITRRL